MTELDINVLKETLVDFVLSDESTDSLKLAINSQFYFKEIANQSVQFPYIVYDFFSNSTKRDSGNKFESIGIQLSIYSDELSSSEIGIIENKVIKKFDDCEASISTASIKIINVTRTSIARLKPDKWQTIISYIFQVQI